MSESARAKLLVCLILAQISTPAAEAAEQGFADKTFLLAYSLSGTVINLKYYVSKSGRVFAFFDTKGRCGIQGSTTQLGRTERSVHKCGSESTQDTFSASVSGDTLTADDRFNGQGSEGGSQGYRLVAFSYNGSTCQALRYSFMFESQQVHFSGQPLEPTPMGCQVISGEAVAADPHSECFVFNGSSFCEGEPDAATPHSKCITFNGSSFCK